MVVGPSNNGTGSSGGANNNNNDKDTGGSDNAAGDKNNKPKDSKTNNSKTNNSSANVQNDQQSSGQSVFTKAKNKIKDKLTPKPKTETKPGTFEKVVNKGDHKFREAGVVGKVKSSIQQGLNQSEKIAQIKEDTFGAPPRTTNVPLNELPFNKHLVGKQIETYKGKDFNKDYVGFVNNKTPEMTLNHENANGFITPDKNKIIVHSTDAQPNEYRVYGKGLPNKSYLTSVDGKDVKVSYSPNGLSQKGAMMNPFIPDKKKVIEKGYQSYLKNVNGQGTAGSNPLGIQMNGETPVEDVGKSIVQNDKIQGSTLTKVKNTIGKGGGLTTLGAVGYMGAQAIGAKDPTTQAVYGGAATGMAASSPPVWQGLGKITEAVTKSADTAKPLFNIGEAIAKSPLGKVVAPLALGFSANSTKDTLLDPKSTAGDKAGASAETAMLGAATGLDATGVGGPLGLIVGGASILARPLGKVILDNGDLSGFAALNPFVDHSKPPQQAQAQAQSTQPPTPTVAPVNGESPPVSSAQNPAPTDATSLENLPPIQPFSWAYNDQGQFVGPSELEARIQNYVLLHSV